MTTSYLEIPSLSTSSKISQARPVGTGLRQQQPALGGMSGRAARKKKLVRSRPVAEEETSGEDFESDVAELSEGPAPSPRLGRSWQPRGMGEPAPRWQKAAVRAVDLKGGQIKSASGTSWVGHTAPGGGNSKVPPRASGSSRPDETFQENHQSASSPSGTTHPVQTTGFPFPGFLGNGTRRVSGGLGDSDPLGAGLVGSEGEGSPPPPPPPDWSDPPDNHGGESGALADTDSESIPSSTHSSVLVDMGKVVGVLRNYTTSQQVDHALLEDGNGVDEDGVSDDEDDDDSVTDGLSFNRPEVCATCAEEARDSELDSLCGDPLVYATFVAPVQQYSTETEPSRQPSVKQNSSEAEGSNPPPAPPTQVQWQSCFFGVGGDQQCRALGRVFCFICAFGGFMILHRAHPIRSKRQDKRAVCLFWLPHLLDRIGSILVEKGWKRILKGFDSKAFEGHYSGRKRYVGPFSFKK